MGRLALLPGAENDEYIPTLILHNFNEGSFINYTVETWQQSIGLLETTAEKAEQWATRLRAVNRLHPVPGMALYKNAPSCKQSLLGAIKAELAVNENGFSHPKPDMQQPDDPSHAPFQTTLSVAQLGLFLRLQVDEKILQTDNNSTLIRNVAARYRTTRANSISHDNLYKKFYSCDPASASIMRTHLGNMLNILKSY